MPRVLIVDDDPELTVALRARLQAEGFDAHAAHSAHEATDLVHRIRPDVILLDIEMPRYNGLELHQCLRFSRRASAVPIVYLSGNDSAANRRIACQQGAQAFIAKPYDASQLIDTLRRLVGNREH